MRITGQREICQVFQRLKTSSWIKIPTPRVAPKDLRDFDIEQVRRVKGFILGEKPLGYQGSGRRIEQDFKQGRGIDDDHRASRSALTAFAGGTLGLTEVRWASRLLNSAIVGRSATRRTS